MSWKKESSGSCDKLIGTYMKRDPSQSLSLTPKRKSSSRDQSQFPNIDPVNASEYSSASSYSPRNYEIFKSRFSQSEPNVYSQFSQSTTDLLSSPSRKDSDPFSRFPFPSLPVRKPTRSHNIARLSKSFREQRNLQLIPETTDKTTKESPPEEKDIFVKHSQKNKKNSKEEALTSYKPHVSRSLNLEQRSSFAKNSARRNLTGSLPASISSEIKQAPEEEEAPLPPGWSAQTVHGKKMYFDHSLNISSFYHPLEREGLPLGWERMVSPEYGIYYVNYFTKERQFEHPSSSQSQLGKTAKVDAKLLPAPSTSKFDQRNVLVPPSPYLYEPIPYWLGVYYKASLEHDKKLKFDLFSLPQLEVYIQMLEAVFKRDMNSIVESYERYRIALQTELLRRESSINNDAAAKNLSYDKAKEEHQRTRSKTLGDFRIQTDESTF